MRRNLQTLWVAAALAAGTFVIVPTPVEPSAAERHADCLEWLRAYGTVVPPDLWGIVGDGKTSEFSTTSEMDRGAVDELVAAQPDDCPPPRASAGTHAQRRMAARGLGRVRRPPTQAPGDKGLRRVSLGVCDLAAASQESLQGPGAETGSWI